MALEILYYASIVCQYVVACACFGGALWLAHKLMKKTSEERNKD